MSNAKDNLLFAKQISLNKKAAISYVLSLAFGIYVLEWFLGNYSSLEIDHSKIGSIGLVFVGIHAFLFWLLTKLIWIYKYHLKRKKKINIERPISGKDLSSQISPESELDFINIIWILGVTVYKKSKNNTFTEWAQFYKILTPFPPENKYELTSNQYYYDLDEFDKAVSQLCSYLKVPSAVEHNLICDEYETKIQELKAKCKSLEDERAQNAISRTKLLNKNEQLREELDSITDKYEITSSALETKTDQLEQSKENEDYLLVQARDLKKALKEQGIKLEASQEACGKLETENANFIKQVKKLKSAINPGAEKKRAGGAETWKGYIPDIVKFILYLHQYSIPQRGFTKRHIIRIYDDYFATFGSGYKWEYTIGDNKNKTELKEPLETIRKSIPKQYLNPRGASLDEPRLNDNYISHWLSGLLQAMSAEEPEPSESSN